ncbi:MAG: 2-C-methyl-D-erythritol 4-phosphate cytidylyltransferase [Pseudomonadota bacterium]
MNSNSIVGVLAILNRRTLNPSDPTDLSDLFAAVSLQDAEITAPVARCFALVPCAGSGSRAGTVMPKQYELIAGQSMVMHTLNALLSVSRLEKIVVVVSPTDSHVWPIETIRPIKCGGATRAESVFNGLTQLLAEGEKHSEGVQPNDWILVHDAARCLITDLEINRLIDTCLDDEVGGLLALPLPDTLKVAVNGRISETLPRQDKWLAQTPQMFRAGALHAALLSKVSENFEGITDEASAMEMAGFAPKLVVGSPHNFKVTYPPDFALAEDLLRSRT